MTYPAPLNQRQHSTTKKLLKKTSLVGSSSGEKDSRFGHSATSSNLHQGTVSVSEDTLGSEKCTPHTFNEPPWVLGTRIVKKKKGFRECQYPPKKKTVKPKRREIQLEIPKNSCSKFPLDESSK